VVEEGRLLRDEEDNRIMPETWGERFVTVNGVRLHVVEAGVGPLVVLLHGFPGFWYCWRRQVPALAGAGFRALAPDLRGYNLSARPHGVAAYAVERLAADVAGLVRSAGVESAAVVGHDWGGVIAWHTAMLYPELVRRLVVLNAPHPATFPRELRKPDQLRRSWYAFFFQLPWLPEALLRRRRAAALARLFRTDPARPGAFTDEDIERYREAFLRPGAATAAINYYRAAGRRLFLRPPPKYRVIDIPTLLIWGERDRHLGVGCTQGLEPWVPRLRVERLPEASHWVMADEPEQVNRLLVEFLRESPAAGPPGGP
jgi:epoxide hydrolase 4